MPEARSLWTTERKLAVFRTCFSGLQHVYGTYDPKTGKARQVKRRVTEQVILRHLRGVEPYGVYLLVGDRTRAVAVDFDDEDTRPPLRFIRRASDYGFQAYLERSKSKGWHTWMFTTLPSVSAAKARLVVRAILVDIGRTAAEVFPKQDRLAAGTRSGNFINAPLFGALVPGGRTVFVDHERGLKVYPSQWELLANVQRVTKSQLDEIVRISGIDDGNHARQCDAPSSASEETRSSFGLPPCAQRMLAEGVSKYQRVACFRLAVHLKKAGIPQDLAVTGLAVWAAKNRPKNGKRVITEAEIIEQTKCAYAKSYRGCGCEEPAVMPFCDASCPLQTAPEAKPTSNIQDPCPPHTEARTNTAQQ